MTTEFFGRRLCFDVDRRRPWIVELGWLASALVAYNAPFWLLSHWMFIDRALINLDGLVAILISRWKPTLGVLAVMVAWGVDAIVSQAMTYHFIAPWDFVRSATFAGALGWKEWMLSARWLVLLPFVGALAALWPLMRRRIDQRVTVAVLVCLTALDALNGSSLLALRDQRLTINVAGSPSATLLFQALQPEQARSIRSSDDPEVARLQERLMNWALEHPEGSVLVILVESMGQPSSPALREWLEDGIRSRGSQDRYELETSTTRFRGATTSGELRALCGLGGNYRALTPEAGRGCLPARLQREGWTTLGLHGFTRRMFERDGWWPMMGLSRQQFAEDLLPTWPECGATFKGVCDRSLIRAAVNAAHTPRTFVYALTLGTHLPVPSTDVDPRLAPLCTQAKVGSDVCQLQTLVRQVLEEVRAGVESTSTPLAVMVTGDHAPPFGSLVSRQAFKSDVVPVFLMLPSARK
jgi:hypothetical protein